MKTSDKIDEDIIRKKLTTDVLGSRIVNVGSIESTNILAKKVAIEGCKEGTVIIADQQTGGKGRMGRQWLSPSGKGVWMSIILKPEIAPAQAPLITSMAAVAVAKTIENITGLKPGIKWPNDVLIGDKKICGILTEMQGDMDAIEYVIVGIGINVNLELDDFPDKLKSRGSSLKIESGNHISRADIIIELLKQFEKLYIEYVESKEPREIISSIEKRSATVGKRIRVIGADREVEGAAVGITDDGALMVMLDNGKMEKVISGDVSIRGVDGYV